MTEIPVKKICIFTNFFSYDECYSLIRVADDQIKMLVSHGYKPKVIVSESNIGSDASHGVVDVHDYIISTRALSEEGHHDHISKKVT